MNLSGLQQKLIAAARTHSPGDNVPYSFEKRIMALLPSHSVVDVWGLWARGLSRAAALCVVAALVLGACTYFLPASHPENLSQEVETTLLAAVDNSAADAAADTE